MTILRLAGSELKRMTGGILPKLTIVALSLVPLLYGAVYLYANWDPYSNLDNIKAALVVEDTGAYPLKPDGTKGEELRAGQTVADNLVENKLFDWQRVDSSAAADEGVRSGQYAFALKIPADFSKNLVSPSSFDSAQQAMLDVTTNDANNYLLSSIVDKLTTAVHASVASQVGQKTADQVLTGFGVIHQNMVKAADGAGQLATGLDKLDDGAGTLSKGLGDLVTGTGQLKDGQGKLLDGANQLANGTSQLNTAANQLNTGAASLKDGTAKANTGAQQLADGAAKLSSGLGQLNSGAAGLPSGTSQLSSGAAQVAAGNAQLNAKVQDIKSQVDKATSQAPAAVDQSLADLVSRGIITQAQADTIRTNLKSAVDSALNTPEIQQAKAQLDAGVADIGKLATGSAQVAAGARQLADNAPALAQGISQANTGASQLATGATSLASGTSQLATGSSQLADGTAKLAPATGQLNTGASQLAAGQKTALDGVSKLNDGAGKLNDGAAQLKTGLDQAKSGTHELADKLRSGSGQVPNPDSSQRENISQVMSDPVKVNNVSQAKAASYGAGLAPFFISLALWIGAFMLVQAMRPLTQRALVSNAPSWKIAVGGWVPFFVVSAVQTVLLWTVVTLGLGLNTVNPGLAFLLLLMASMAFTALIQGIVALMGTPGKFVVLILLVLQLVSAGGTFPWQTTPQPLHVVHELLPLGYVVTGMRHLVYGGDLSMIAPIMLGLVGYTLLGLAFSWIAVNKHKTWTLKAFKPEISV